MKHTKSKLFISVVITLGLVVITLGLMSGTPSFFDVSFVADAEARGPGRRGTAVRRSSSRKAAVRHSTRRTTVRHVATHRRAHVRREHRGVRVVTVECSAEARYYDGCGTPYYDGTTVVYVDDNY